MDETDYIATNTREVVAAQAETTATTEVLPGEYMPLVAAGEKLHTYKSNYSLLENGATIPTSDQDSVWGKIALKVKGSRAALENLKEVTKADDLDNKGGATRLGNAVCGHILGNDFSGLGLIEAKIDGQFLVLYPKDPSDQATLRVLESLNGIRQGESIPQVSISERNFFSDSPDLATNIPVVVVNLPLGTDYAKPEKMVAREQSEYRWQQYKEAVNPSQKEPVNVLDEIKALMGKYDRVKNLDKLIERYDFKGTRREFIEYQKKQNLQVQYIPDGLLDTDMEQLSKEIRDKIESNDMLLHEQTVKAADVLMIDGFPPSRAFSVDSFYVDDDKNYAKASEEFGGETTQLAKAISERFEDITNRYSLLERLGDPEAKGILAMLLLHSKEQDITNILGGLSKLEELTYNPWQEDRLTKLRDYRTDFGTDPVVMEDFNKWAKSLKSTWEKYNVASAYGYKSAREMEQSVEIALRTAYVNKSQYHSAVADLDVRLGLIAQNAVDKSHSEALIEDQRRKIQTEARRQQEQTLSVKTSQLLLRLRRTEVQ